MHWEYSQSCWYGIFDLVLWTIAPPSNLLSGSTPPTFPPSQCQSAVYKDSVWLGGGEGCWVLLETIFCRSLTLCIWPDSEPTKLLDHPKRKPKKGRGRRRINTCRKVPFQVNFYRWRHFALLSISLIFLRHKLSLSPFNGHQLIYCTST